MNKYNATKKAVGGLVFASKREAQRYEKLVLRVVLNEIDHLETQPRFPLYVGEDKPILVRSKRYTNGRHATYVADFMYYDKAIGGWIVEDVKGFDTPLSRLKRAIVEAYEDVEIVLI